MRIAKFRRMSSVCGCVVSVGLYVGFVMIVSLAVSNGFLRTVYNNESILSIQSEKGYFNTFDNNIFWNSVKVKPLFSDNQRQEYLMKKDKI